MHASSCLTVHIWTDSLFICSIPYYSSCFLPSVWSFLLPSVKLFLYLPWYNSTFQIVVLKLKHVERNDTCTYPREISVGKIFCVCKKFWPRETIATLHVVWFPRSISLSSTCMWLNMCTKRNPISLHHTDSLSFIPLTNFPLSSLPYPCAWLHSVDTASKFHSPCQVLLVGSSLHVCFPIVSFSS